MAKTMEKIKKQKENDFDVEIGLKDAKEWNDEDLAKAKAFVNRHAANRTPERKLKNEMLSIKYQMEELLCEYVQI